jgi:hypothetical protein
MRAALLIAARPLLVHFGLPCPSAEAIVSATGATRSRAYEMAQTVVGLLPTLIAPPGRPRKPVEAVAPDTDEITRAVLRYVMEHPGSVDRGGQRQRYSDSFRHFVLGLRDQYADIEVEPFARASQIALGTLKDWLRDRTREVTDGQPATWEPSDTLIPDAEDAQMQTVLDAWSRWQGSFVDFCQHVRRDLRVPFGRDLIRRILETYRLRKTARRPGRGPDELASRSSFRTFFPGAQWIGDGMQVPVVINGQSFTLNVELNVDGYSGAFVGSSVRETEDSAAVIEAFRSGVATTGKAPLAELLDNRPSNHTPEVDAALGDTLRIRATPGRGQNKAHVEGAFGLFSQVLPPLILDTHRPAQDVAKSMLGLVVDVWSRTTNHRPRVDRGDRSRVDCYGETVSDDQIEDARRHLREIAERQQRARQTLETRRRPEVLCLLDEHFDRLGLLDPERHVRIAIAGYPLSAIADGLALFRAKAIAKTLPEGVDARYLLGIVRNIAADIEGEHFASSLLRVRLEARDRMLAPLVARRDTLLASSDAPNVLNQLVDSALNTQSPLERAFWLDAVADQLNFQPVAQSQRLFLDASRRIYATFAITIRERQQAVRFLADRLVPLS